jgi:hypothetical protein
MSCVKLFCKIKYFRKTRPESLIKSVTAGLRSVERNKTPPLLFAYTYHSHILSGSRPRHTFNLYTDCSYYYNYFYLYTRLELKVPFIKDVIQEKSINHHDKLGNHSNPILQPLLEQQQRSRLKKLWPADLTDG